MTAPTENILRAQPEAVELRDAGDTEDGVMYGEFAKFNQWTEINSAWEGNFLEQIAPGAFARSIAERGSQVKVLFDHGRNDNRPLGTIRSLSETKTGAAYEVDLFTDASYVRDLMPALRAGALGASFRFSVKGEEWVNPARATTRNPNKLPERTITDVDLYEFGPVTFPAYAAASAGMRSITDAWYDDLLSDPANLARLLERLSTRAAAKLLSDLPDHVGSDGTSTGLGEQPGHAGGIHPSVAHARARALTLKR